MCTGQRSHRENRPQLQLGLFFYRLHAQGEVYPFAGGGLKQRPGKPGRTAFHPSPIPPPRVYYRLGKRKGTFSTRLKRGERKIDQTIIGIDHGYYAIKTRHCVFPTGITAYDHEPYTRQDVLEYEGRWYVCGTGLCPSRFRGQ